MFVDEADHVGKGGTFGLARGLEEGIAAVADAAGGDSARLLAARRAALTAVCEIAHRVDDSYGQIVELGQAVWTAYAATRWRELVPDEVYWRDVAQLVAFDDYAHLYGAETVPWRQARAGDLPLLRGVLLELADEYAAAAGPPRTAGAGCAGLGAPGDPVREPLRGRCPPTWLGALDVARWAGRVRAAAHRPDVAAAVFDAADQPGLHREYLYRRRRELLKAPAVPPLRVVKGE